MQNNLFILVGLFCFNQNANAAIDKKFLTTTNNKTVTIAVIDTGCDIQHQDLKNNIWTNPGETGIDSFGRNKESNQIDDDTNGFVDDIHGWNFITNSNQVFDENGHGTHVSGIIVNQFKKQTTKSNLEQNLKLMILKYYDPKAKQVDNLNHSVQAIEYANKMKVQVINYSGGGSEIDNQEFEAIKKSEELGILFIAAAGNNKSNTDYEKFYPANYLFQNIISVAATTDEGNISKFSNYGSRITIAAPGQFITSTYPNNSYGVLSGTSQATAFATGVIASMIAPKKMSMAEIKEKLLIKANYHKSLQGKIKMPYTLIQKDN